MSTADVVRCAPQRRAALASAFRACERITLNAETAEAAEKKCPRISQRALRALRSTSHFFTGSEGGHYIRFSVIGGKMTTMTRREHMSRLLGLATLSCLSPGASAAVD